MTYKSMTDDWLRPKWRQRLVNLIEYLWPYMPRRAKIWAFMNDGELKDDYKFNSKT